MRTTAKNPDITPIPVQLAETEFNEFIFPHLSMPKRGPRCKIGYHRLFNLILWVLYTGMQWKCLPMPKDPPGKPDVGQSANSAIITSLTSSCRSYWQTSHSLHERLQSLCQMGR
jgi:transposase